MKPVLILTAVLITALGLFWWQSHQRAATAVTEQQSKLEKIHSIVSTAALHRDEADDAAKEAERRNLDDQLVTWLTDARAALRAGPADQPGRIINLQQSVSTAHDSAKAADVRSKISSVQLALGFIPEPEGLHRLIDRLEAQALLAPQASR